MPKALRQISDELRAYDQKHRLSETALEWAEGLKYVGVPLRTWEFMNPLGNFAPMHKVLGKYLKRGVRVVEIGAGTSIYPRYLQDAMGIDAHAVDINEHAVEIARRLGTKNVTKGDAVSGRLPFKAGEVDIVLSRKFLLSGYQGIDSCLFGLEPIGSLSALPEVHRILKPGGKALIDEHDIELKRDSPLLHKIGAIGFHIENVAEGDSPMLLLRKKRSVREKTRIRL